MLFTGLNTTMVSIFAPKALAISLDLVIANDTQSITAAAARYATAFSDVFDSKKPTTTTSSLAMNSLAASTSVSSTAGDQSSSQPSQRFHQQYAHLRKRTITKRVNVSIEDVE